MAPEQARGETDSLDQRCDVFGLGAVLCEILTGQAPYVGTAQQVQRDARAGQLTAAFWRLDDCGADAELVRLAKTCLHPLPAERPRDAGVVAEAVSAYLAGVQERLRQAELERAGAQAREAEARARAEAQGLAYRAERRARRRTLALAAVLVAALLLGGWWWRERQVRSADTLQEVTRALGKVEQLREDARRITPDNLNRAESALALWKQALATVEQAERAMAAGLADEATRLRVRSLRQELEQDEREADRDFAMANELAEIRLRLSETTDIPVDIDRVARDYGTAFKAYGIDVLQLEESEAAARLASRAIKQQLAFALDGWAGLMPTGSAQRLLRLAARVDDDPWRNRVREAWWKSQTNALRELAASEKIAAQPVETLLLISYALERLGNKKDVEVARSLLRGGQRRHPDDFWINHNLSLVLMNLEPPQWEEALRFATAAAALRPRSPVARMNVGVFLGKKGDWAGSLAACQEALRLKNFPEGQSALAAALLSTGDWQGALSACQEALRLRPDFPDAYCNLGGALVMKGDLTGAVSALRQALRLRPEYPAAQSNLGHALLKSGEVDGAIAACKEALRLKKNYPLAYVNLGRALYLKGDSAGAIDAFEKALGLNKDYSDAHLYLGIVLHRTEELDRAIAALNEALRLKKENPQAHYFLGVIAYRKGKIDGAIAAWKEALRLKPDYPEARCNLGSVLLVKGDVDGAVAACKEALRLKKDFQEAHVGLANALQARGDTDGAIAEYRQAVSLQKDSPEAHCNLASALAKKGDFADAIASYRESLRLKKDYPLACFNLGAALLQRGEFRDALAVLQQGQKLGSKQGGGSLRFAELIQRCQRLIELDGRLSAALGKEGQLSAADNLGFGILCSCKGLYVAAARFYAQAFRAQPKLTQDLKTTNRFDAACSATQAGCGCGEDAAQLDAEERAFWRRQAREWLQADLKLWAELLEGKAPRAAALVRQMLQAWQYEPRLSGLREEKALAKLPPAEQQACRQLWAEVAALLKRAAGAQ
jgi:tetratricopeptide (TPR) repeat protein